jgi:hypothetical protein
MRTLSFQITILGNDSSVRRLQPVTTESTIVFLGEHIQSESARRRAMGYGAGRESKATSGQKKGLSDGKTYGYQRAADTESDATTSLETAKAQLLEAFGQFVDVLVNAYQPRVGHSPQPLQGMGADDGHGTNASPGPVTAVGMGQGNTGSPSTANESRVAAPGIAGSTGAMDAAGQPNGGGRESTMSGQTAIQATDPGSKGLTP